MDDAPVVAPVAQREFSDIEIARMLGRVLTLAAQRLNIFRLAGRLGSTPFAAQS
jgi:hypothetical protein